MGEWSKEVGVWVTIGTGSERVHSLLRWSLAGGDRFG